MKFKTFVKALNIMFTIFIIIHLSVLTVLAYNSGTITEPMFHQPEIVKTYVLTLTISFMLMGLINMIYGAYESTKGEDK